MGGDHEEVGGDGGGGVDGGGDTGGPGGGQADGDVPELDTTRGQVEDLGRGGANQILKLQKISTCKILANEVLEIMIEYYL